MHKFVTNCNENTFKVSFPTIFSALLVGDTFETNTIQQNALLSISKQNVSGQREAKIKDVLFLRKEVSHM